MHAYMQLFWASCGSWPYSSAPKPPDPGIGRSGTPTATPDRDLSVFALEMGPLTITSSEPVYRLSPQSETRGVRALFMWW